MKKANFLEKGSVIGIAAPAAAFSREEFLAGVNVLNGLGYQPKFSESIFRKEKYLAGGDQERAKELNGLFADPEIDAIMFARGGYGVQRIMPHLDFSLLKKRPKLVIGFSDLTPLLGYINSKFDIPCLYGPVVAQLSSCDEETITSFSGALTGEFPKEMKGLKILKEGNADGCLVGGCLSLLATSMGTGYQLKTKGSIIFIEDHGERVYRYDRMLTQLKNAGLFEKAKGIVFGPMKLASDEIDSTGLWEMVAGIFENYSGPVVCGLNSGHTMPFMTLPLGAKCKIEDDKLIFV